MFLSKSKQEEKFDAEFEKKHRRILANQKKIAKEKKNLDDELEEAQKKFNFWGISSQKK
jgi:hypothetical protein